MLSSKRNRHDHLRDIDCLLELFQILLQVIKAQIGAGISLVSLTDSQEPFIRRQSDGANIFQGFLLLYETHGVVSQVSDSYVFAYRVNNVARLGSVKVHDAILEVEA